MSEPFERLGLIGCGLMGGSFALALRRAGLVRHISGYDQSPQSMQAARKMGVIDTLASSAATAAKQADLVMIAVPVSGCEAVFRQIEPVLAPDSLLLDVGSTKRNMVDSAHRTLQDKARLFVPCHPIAGRELAGAEHADAQLFQDRQVILTPLDCSLAGHVERARSLWHALGARVSQMTAEAHDAALAAVSHLPHLLAFALMDGIMAQPEGQAYLSLAGPGFRDFSRIAASDPQVWRDILLANREEISRQSLQFQQALKQLETMMSTGDEKALENRIQAISQSRAKLSPASSKAP